MLGLHTWDQSNGAVMIGDGMWFMNPNGCEKMGTNEVSYYHMLSLLGENPDN